MGIGVSAWRSWKLDGHRYAYIWVDGVYLGDGVDREKTALLCVVGAREDGRTGMLRTESCWVWELGIGGECAAVGGRRRSAGVVDCTFSAVRLRTDVTRRMKRRDSALYLVFKVALRLSERWRPLNGGRNLMGLLVDGARFKNGILDELPVTAEGAVAS